MSSLQSPCALDSVALSVCAGSMRIGKLTSQNQSILGAERGRSCVQNHAETLAGEPTLDFASPQRTLTPTEMCEDSIVITKFGDQASETIDDQAHDNDVDRSSSNSFPGDRVVFP